MQDIKLSPELQQALREANTAQPPEHKPDAIELLQAGLLVLERIATSLEDLTTDLREGS